MNEMPIDYARVSTVDHDLNLALQRGTRQRPLEEPIAIYERGGALKTLCAALLRDAEMRIEKITLGPGGQPSGMEPFDAG